MCRPSSAGSRSGNSSRRWDPRDSSRSSAKRAIRRASGYGSESSRSSSSALRSGPGELPDGLPGLGEGRVEAPGGRSAAGRRGPSAAEAARAALAPSTKHSVSEFEASRFAPCSPVQAHSPTANRPGSEERPSRSVGDPAHHVVGGGGHRDRLLRPGRIRPFAEAANTLGKRASLSSRMSSRTWSVAIALHPIEHRERDLVARGELVREPLAVCVEQRAPSPRTASVTSRPSCLVPGGRECRRVELAELQVGEIGAGGVGHHRPGADRAPGVGGPGPERGGAAGGEDRRGRLDLARSR